MTLLVGSLQLGFIYGLLALGIYISFRVLDIPDLTADGSFTLGLAVSAAFTVSGHPLIGMAAGMAAGAAAGSVTGLMQTKLQIHPILSGILTMSGLYTVNLFCLGNASNLSLIGHDTLFSLLQEATGLQKETVRLLAVLLLCVLLAALLTWFFKTHLGLCIRATGDNADMVRASSINVDAMKITALSVSNACVALSGAVLAQYQGFADVGSGVGIVVVGLASVIIGEVFFGRRSVLVGLLSAVSGSIAYRFIMALALRTKIFPTSAIKLVSAVIVVIALSLPVLKKRAALGKSRKEAEKIAGA